MANVTQIVTVHDSSTHNPLAGALVFVNGVSSGTTDSSGNVTLSIPAGTFDLSVKATNYVTQQTNGVVAPQTNLIINLETSVAATTTSFRLVINPEDKANGLPIAFDNAGSPIDANYQIGGIDVAGLTIGPQVVTGSLAGFQPVNQTFDLTKATSGVILLTVASDDFGGALSQRAEIVQDPDLNALLLPTVPENLPEYVAPNTGTGTYFTMTQARVYIGDLFIDELNSLQWALQDNKIPVYGYASRFWDITAQGKSLVQGQFSINFISEGYMVKTLENYAKKIDQGDHPQDKQLADNEAKLLSLVSKLQNPDPNWTPAQFTRAKQEVQNLAAQMPVTSVQKASAQIRLDQKNQLNSILGLAGEDFANAVYSDVPFDIVVQYSGAGRIITRRLEECNLISNESIMDHSGTPILDSYGFIARRVR